MSNTNFAAKALDDSIKLSKIRNYCKAVKIDIGYCKSIGEIEEVDDFILDIVDEILKIIEGEE